MSEPLKGVLAAIMACCLWGGTGVFYDQLTHLDIWEVMAHRTLWTCLIFFGVLAALGQLSAPLQAMRGWRPLVWIAFAALMMSLNWLVFVYAVQIERALDASLGYFVFPLVAVLMGVLFFGERLGRAQSLAVALAALAVGVLTWGLGVAPWIAMLLAVSFALYGVAKRFILAGPIASVTAEALLILPPFLIYLIMLHATGQGAFGRFWQDSLFLALSGPMVAVPLILFSYAATRITMASLGVINYLNPTIQFCAATLVLKEPLGLWHSIAFAMIWAALVIYTTAVWRQDRAVRKTPVNSGTVSTSRK